MSRYRRVRRGYKPSPRKQARAEALDLFRLALRDRGWCEAQGLFHDGDAVCGSRRAHLGTDPHHVWPEDRDAGRHDPERGLWLCRRAHDWTHANPAAAAALGLLRPDRAPAGPHSG